MDGQFVSLLRRFTPYADGQQITEDTRLRDLGLTSLREIELLFAVEDAYDIQISDDKLADRTFETGGRLWSVVSELCAQRGARP
jgi:acyl carrier protein